MSPPNAAHFAALLTPRAGLDIFFFFASSPCEQLRQRTGLLSSQAKCGHPADSTRDVRDARTADILHIPFWKNAWQVPFTAVVGTASFASESWGTPCFWPATCEFLGEQRKPSQTLCAAVIALKDFVCLRRKHGMRRQDVQRLNPHCQQQRQRTAESAFDLDGAASKGRLTPPSAIANGSCQPSHRSRRLGGAHATRRTGCAVCQSWYPM